MFLGTYGQLTAFYGVFVAYCFTHGAVTLHSLDPHLKCLFERILELSHHCQGCTLYAKLAEQKRPFPDIPKEASKRNIHQFFLPIFSCLTST